MYQSSTITLLQIDKKTETPSINITDEITSDHLVLFSSTTTVLFSSCEVGSFAKLCPSRPSSSESCCGKNLLVGSLPCLVEKWDIRNKKDPKSDKYYTNHQDLVQFQSANLSNSAAISPQARPRSYLQLLIYCPQDCRSLCAAYVRQLGNPVASRRSIFFRILEVR